MSLKSTKEHLTRLLADKDTRVVALSGKWGTGKSYLWQEIKVASEDDKVNGSLYVSLFGLSGIDEIKMKLIQSAVPAAQASPRVWKTARQAVKSGVKALEGFHKGFSALSGVGLMLVPAMLHDKLIVLDDIERKHEDLSILEVLGFIDEFTQQHGSRFVLILNSDQLLNREVWDTLREKVVDQELRLNTSPTEAFEIAISLFPSRYANLIQAAVEKCGVTNIRIIGKIIKAANRILAGREQLPESVLSHVIPSTVLLAAINYKGMEDGPDVDFVLAQGTVDWTEFVNDEQEKTEEDKRKGKWKLLLNDLGIIQSDEYELLVVEFLQSGLFDVADVSAIIDRYVTATEAMEAQQASREFLRQHLWDHRLSEGDLLERAEKLVPQARFLDPYSVTSLHCAVAELPDGEPVADAIVTGWIDEFKAKNLKQLDRSDTFDRPIHPRIKVEFDVMEVSAQSNITALEAILHIVKNSGWGPRQELALKSATIAEFESIMKTSDIEDLRTFMRKMLELTIHKDNYQSHFGSAIDHFVQACRNIAHNPQSIRLGKLIKSVFASSKLEALLRGK